MSDPMTPFTVEGLARKHIENGCPHIFPEWKAAVTVPRCCIEAAIREALDQKAEWACPLCHCCGEKRHDGGDPCVACAVTRDEALEEAEKVCNPANQLCGCQGRIAALRETP